VRAAQDALQRRGTSVVQGPLPGGDKEVWYKQAFGQGSSIEQGRGRGRGTRGRLPTKDSRGDGRRIGGGGRGEDGKGGDEIGACRG